MPNITLGQVQELNDPKLQEIAKRVYNTFRLAAEKSVAHHNNPTQFPLPTESGNLESIFLNRLRSLHPERQKSAVNNVMRLVNAPDNTRKKLYKNLSVVNLKSSVPVEKQVTSLALPDSLKMKLDDLAKLPYANGVLSQELTTELAAGPTSVAAMKKLELRIRTVKCVDETGDWVEWGDDEIHLGGTTTDATGDTKKVSAFKVGDFNDGTVKNYAPPKSFCVFDITKGDKWPKSYFVTFVLAEKDNGGLPNFINDLTNKVREKVTATLAALLGGAIGSSGGPVGTAIGAVTAIVVNWVIDYLIGVWNDDVFPPQTVSIALPSSNVRFNGKPETPVQVAKFKGHDGYYRLMFTWGLS